MLGIIEECGISTFKMSEKKGHPSQGRALQRAREEIKRLENNLRNEGRDKANLRRENERLKDQVSRLKEEIRNLRGVPEFIKPNKPEGVEKVAKKKGPKFGHSANRRKLPERIDREVKIIAKRCPDCNHKLPPPAKWHTHVQIDIPPPPRPVVTRYHVGWSWCSRCERRVSLGNKLSHSQYGPHLHAQISYWRYQLGLTLGKIETLFREQYELEISSGQISEMLIRVGRQFDGAYEDLKLSLAGQEYLHADETGWREDGNNRWLWSFSNDELSFYHMDVSRGRKVVKDVLGKSFDGILLSDFYGSYNEIDCDKQKCWTHLLRELRELKAKYPKCADIIRYSKQLKRFFRRAKGLKELYEKGKNIDRAYNRLFGDTERFAHRKQKHPDLTRISKRIIKHRGSLYTFIKTGVDPTNNYAEREIRPAVLMRKQSYGNRSKSGGRTQAILMSMIRSSQKQGRPFLPYAAQFLTQH
jgi:transposase